MTSDPDPYEFLSVDQIKETVTQKAGKPDILVRIELSANLISSERSVYTFFTLIGDLGGFNAAIIILPAFVMSLYSKLMFQSSVQEEITTR